MGNRDSASHDTIIHFSLLRRSPGSRHENASKDDETIYIFSVSLIRPNPPDAHLTMVGYYLKAQLRCSPNQAVGGT